ncbi:unnamed protein product [Moneuplotes crassus]|uniref:Uncharacterized protein n=1 Tax=Euplotes crassus TaxID=5936 RepID=A0AAD1XZW6_EUPCR|nr:unnamed protein product [Moneuplotes crassus]
MRRFSTRSTHKRSKEQLFQPYQDYKRRTRNQKTPIHSFPQNKIQDEGEDVGSGPCFTRSDNSSNDHIKIRERVSVIGPSGSFPILNHSATQIPPSYDVKKKNELKSSLFQKIFSSLAIMGVTKDRLASQIFHQLCALGMCEGKLKDDTCVKIKVNEFIFLLNNMGYQIPPESAIEVLNLVHKCDPSEKQTLQVDSPEMKGAYCINIKKLSDCFHANPKYLKPVNVQRSKSFADNKRMSLFKKISERNMSSFGSNKSFTFNSGGETSKSMIKGNKSLDPIKRDPLKRDQLFKFEVESELKNDPLASTGTKLIYDLSYNDLDKGCSRGTPLRYETKKAIKNYMKMVSKVPYLSKKLSKNLLERRAQPSVSGGKFRWKSEIQKTVKRIKERKNLQGINLSKSILEEICKKTGKMKTQISEEDVLEFTVNYPSFTKLNAMRGLQHYQAVSSVTTKRMKSKEKLMKNFSLTGKLHKKQRKRMSELLNTRFK